MIELTGSEIDLVVGGFERGDSLEGFRTEGQSLLIVWASGGGGTTPRAQALSAAVETYATLRAQGASVQDALADALAEAGF